MDRLDKSINSLLETYGEYGMINHSGGANLPGRAGIERILNGLDELIFPGFRENSGLDHNNLRLITAETDPHPAGRSKTIDGQNQA